MGYLKGKALEDVEPYLPTEENYPIIVGILEKNYGDPRLIAESLQSEFFALPKARNDPQSLRAASRALERICQQLTQLKVDENSALFLLTAKTKLPDEVLKALVKEERAYKALHRTPWKMAEFRRALAEHIDDLEEVARCSKAMKSPQVVVATNLATNQAVKKKTGRQWQPIWRPRFSGSSRAWRRTDSPSRHNSRCSSSEEAAKGKGSSVVSFLCKGETLGF
jgi:hypothetical protein